MGKYNLFFQRSSKMYKMRHGQSERIGHWDNKDVVRFHYQPRQRSPTKYTPKDPELLQRPPTIGAKRVRQTPTYESHVFTKYEATHLPNYHAPTPSQSEHQSVRGD